MINFFRHRHRFLIFSLILLCITIGVLRTLDTTVQAAWSPTHGNWLKRRLLNVVNSSPVTLHTNTPIAITIDTKTLVAQSKLRPDCSDLRILYQPSDTVYTELNRHLVFTGGTTCSTSSTTKVYFNLQTDLSSSSTSTLYYLYYNNPHAEVPANTDNAFDIGAVDALLVCPFDGTTTCAAGETPSTATGAIRYSAGKSAMSFDMSDDIINAGSTSTLDDLHSGSVTYEMWVKLNSSGESSGILFTKGGAGFTTSFYAYTLSNQIIAGVGASGAGAWTSASTAVAGDAVWHHLAFTYDNSGDRKVRIWIDGVATAGSAASGTITSDAANDLILGNMNNGNRTIHGLIDEVRVSNIVRYTSSFTPSTTPFVRDEYTKLLLHFDENGDDPRNTGKAIDDSGNANHGTITGAKYVDGLVGVDNSSSNIQSQSYAGHEGVFIEEGTTNKITNPSFEHTAFDTNWTAGGNNTVTVNTTASYYKFGSQSAKIVNVTAADTFNTAINAGNTNTHTLTAYVYDGTTGNIGGTVSSSIAKLVFNGSTVTPASYTDVGGGWWRLSYSAAVSNSSTNYGVEVQAGKTIYVDGIQLEEKVHVTSYTDGSLGTGYSWSGTAHESTSTRVQADLNYGLSGNVDSSEGSISTWIKLNENCSVFGNGSYNDIFTVKGTDTAQQYIYLGLHYETSNGCWARTHVRNYSESVSNKSISSSIKDSWLHVVGTWSKANNEVKVYVNGEAGSTGTYTFTAPPLTSSLFIGRNTYQADRNLDGQISNLMVYNQPLTATQITDLYQSGLVSHQNTPNTVVVDRFIETTTESVATNKITNPSFEHSTFNTNWTTTQPYTLQDEFTTDRAAGAVNGTNTENEAGVSTGGTRTVVDTNSKISISSGVLNWATGTSANDYLKYTALSRTAGLTILSKINFTSGDLYFGDYISGGGLELRSNNIVTVKTTGASGPIIGTYSNSTDYIFATVYKTTGTYLYVKGGSQYPNWTLLYIYPDGTTGVTPKFFVGSNPVFTADNIRIPTATWLPTPLAYDTFGTAGATTTETTGPDSQAVSALSWTGGTKSGGKMVVTQTMGSELSGDVGFDNAVYWAVGAGVTVSDSKANWVNAGTAVGFTKDPLLTIGNWYRNDFTVDSFSGSGAFRTSFFNGGSSLNISTTGNKIETGRATGTSYYIRTSTGGTINAVVDSASLKPLTLSSLFSTVPTSDANVIADVTISSATAGTQAGLVLNLDSTSSPSNFIIVYHDGTNLRVEEAVAGVYTTKQTTAVALGAGALRVIRDGTKLRVYLNNALIGSELTMTANTNTIHGLFSTYSGNTFDNFSLFPRGTDGEYAGLPAEPSEVLVATENTNTAYTRFGGKSTKLVNNGTTMQYVTSINPANTNTHTLSAYIYDGTAGSTPNTPINETVARLVFNGTAVTPTYINVGNGWWRLTYSATTTNSSGNYGVEVLANKTIYMDGVQLEENSKETSYTDGSIGRGYTWSGVVNDSTSVRTGGGGKGQSPTSVYHMDEGYGTTVHDSTTNFNHLTLSGASWIPASAGMTGGKYLKFDGVNDYLTQSFDSDFNYGTDSFTLSGVFKHPSTISGTDTLISRYSSTGYKVYMNSSGYLCFGIDDDSSWGPDDSACSTTSYADSKWHSFSAVRNSSTSILLYVDGVVVGSDYSLSATGTLSSTIPLYIGIDSDSTSNPYDGFLDELAFYPYDRDATQVKTDNLGQQLSTLIGTRQDDNLTDGLVGWWKMDEASTPSLDSSGNGNSGTWAGNTTAVAGKYGNATSFDGNGDYVGLEATSALQPTSAITIASWFKTSTSVNYERIISNGASNHGYEININTSGKIEFNLGIGGVEHDVSSNNSPLLDDGNWHLVTGTYDGQFMKIYVDGVLQSDVDSVLGSINYGTTSFKIGSGSLGLSGYWNGLIDDTRIYNRALTSNEISQLYMYAPGPMVHYDFNEKTGTVVNDKSGNGYHGTWGGTGSHWTVGKYDNAGNFNGLAIAADRVVGPTLPAAFSYTIEGWYKMTTTQLDTYNGLYGGWGGFDGNDVNTGINTGGIITYPGGVEPWIQTGDVDFNNNQWRYLSMVYDGSTFKIYIDGALATSQSRSLTVSPATFVIGARSTFSRGYRGQIDDFKIYNYARTQKQIIQDMQGSSESVVVSGGQVSKVSSKPSSPIAYYKFDEGQGTIVNNAGSEGNTLNGTLTNMASPATATSGWTNSGKFNKSLQFDGINDYINMGNQSRLTFTGAFSASAWVKPSAFHTGNADNAILSKHDDAWSQRGYILYLDSTGQLIFETSNNCQGSGMVRLSTGYYLSVSQWHHIVGLYDGSKMYTYVNGRQVGTPIAQSSICASSANFVIGARYGAGNPYGYFPGAIDDVKLYNYALSSEEVKQDYNRGSSMVLGSSSANSYLAYDTFSRGENSSLGSTEVKNGASSLSWTGSTWTVVGGKAVNTPVTFGAEKVTNGDMELNASWGSAGGGSYFGQSSEQARSGTSSWKVISTGVNQGGNQNVTNLTVGLWYYYQLYLYTASGTAFSSKSVGGNLSSAHAGTASWSLVPITYRATSTSSLLYFYSWLAGTYYADDASLKSLTLSELIASVNSSKKDLAISVDAVISQAANSGVVLNLDSASNPQNFVLAYYDSGVQGGGHIKLDKVVSGTYTNLIDVAATYVAGAPIKVVKRGTTYTLYYNNIQIGTTQTISDSAIINNTRFGMFSTYSGNTLDNFSLEDLNTNLEYSVPGGGDGNGAPVVEWKFDEGAGQAANDSSGNNNTGTLGSSSSPDSYDPVWTLGKFGKGLRLDGVDDSVSMGDMANLGSTYTFNFWAKVDDITKQQVVFGKDDIVLREFDIDFNLQAGKIDFYGFKSDGGYFRYSANHNLNQNWHFWSIVANGSDVKIYKDGVDLNASLATGTFGALQDTSTALLVGRRAPGDNFDGLLDDIRIYNYARTPAQIAWDYNRGEPIGWWKLDECTGTVAHDASVNQNNGTITIGATGAQTSAGTCSDGAATSAWYNGKTGKLNGSLNFDGTDDYINAGNQTIFNFNNTGFSFGAWVKPKSQTGYILARYTALATYQLQYDASVSKFNFFLRDSASNNTGFVATSRTFTPDSWYFVMVVVDKSSNLASLYINDVLEATADISTLSNISPNANLVIGAQVTTPSSLFKGMIDDVRLYNYALTREQVKGLFNGGAVRFGQ